MTEITFYTFASDPLDVARRIASKAYSQGKHVMIYAADESSASTVDRLLWAQPALGFIPHCRDTDALANETPVVIGTRAEALARADVMINLDHELPPAFARFERLIEIVGATDNEREQGRQRYRFYQSRGYALKTHDLREQGS